MIGRIIGIICCLCGTFSLSLVVVTLMLFISLNEDEYKAHEDIDFVLTKNKKHNIYTMYFNSYMRYKFANMRKVTDHIQDYFIKKNDFQMLKDRYFLRLRAKTVKRQKIDEFGISVQNIWENDLIPVMDRLIMKLSNIHPKSEVLAYGISNYIENLKISKHLSFKLINIMRFISVMGNVFKFNNIHDIKGSGVISLHAMISALQEFQIRYRDCLFIDQSSNAKKKYHEDFDESQDYMVSNMRQRLVYENSNSSSNSRRYNKSFENSYFKE